MGVYIPNIKPEQFYELCKQKGIEIIAVPVPEHGRLIDADAMCDGLVLNNPVVIYAECMPTIIPAEEGE